MEQTLWTMPGASDGYHAAREELLNAEVELQKHVEQVAAMRRGLPAGPTVPDYEFLDGAVRCRLSDLFADGKPYLVVYHVMYWQDDEEFCPMCSMWVDGWNGVADHVAQRTNMIATTLAPVDTAQAWAQRRGWGRIRFLADANDSFARDTMAQDSSGEPVSTVLVFEKTSDGIRHLYTAHAEGRPGLIRGLDQLCATWHIEDLLPSGRGDWNAGNDYVK
jgi:predicted dithiol-disulfide oxidoreductase (DUF899 family)